MLDVVSSENREKTLRFVLTFYRQATDRLPTHYQQSAHCRPTGSLYFGQNLSADSQPTVSWQTTNCRPTDDQLLADCRPTVDWQSADRFFGELFLTITEKSINLQNFRIQFHFIIQTKSWLNLSGHYGRWCWGFSVPNILRLHVQPLLSKWDLHNKVWPIILILKMNISGLLYASYLVLLMNRNNIENHL